MASEIPRKIYRISPLRRAFFSGVWIYFSVLLLVLSIFENELSSKSALYAGAGLVFVLGTAMTPLVWYTRLSLTPDGIELRQFGWRARVPWDNIAEVVLEWRAFGLVLKESMNRSAAINLRIGNAIPYWYTEWQRSLVREGLWLPLEPFFWSWKHGGLRRDFQGFAPGVSLPETNPKTGPYTRSGRIEP